MKKKTHPFLILALFALQVLCLSLPSVFPCHDLVARLATLIYLPSTTLSTTTSAIRLAIVSSASCVPALVRNRLPLLSRVDDLGSAAADSHATESSGDIYRTHGRTWLSVGRGNRLCVGSCRHGCGLETRGIRVVGDRIFGLCAECLPAGSLWHVPLLRAARRSDGRLPFCCTG